MVFRESSILDEKKLIPWRSCDEGKNRLLYPAGEREKSVTLEGRGGKGVSRN